MFNALELSKLLFILFRIKSLFSIYFRLLLPGVLTDPGSSMSIDEDEMEDITSLMSQLIPVDVIVNNELFKAPNATNYLKSVGNST